MVVWMSSARFSNVGQETKTFPALVITAKRLALSEINKEIERPFDFLC